MPNRVNVGTKSLRVADPDDQYPRIDRVVRVDHGPAAWLRRLLRRDPKLKVLRGVPMNDASLDNLKGAPRAHVADLHLGDLLVTPRVADPLSEKDR